MVSVGGRVAAVAVSARVDPSFTRSTTLTWKLYGISCATTCCPQTKKATMTKEATIRSKGEFVLGAPFVGGGHPLPP